MKKYLLLALVPYVMISAGVVAQPYNAAQTRASWNEVIDTDIPNSQGQEDYYYPQNRRGHCGPHGCPTPTYEQGYQQGYQQAYQQGYQQGHVQGGCGPQGCSLQGGCGPQGCSVQGGQQSYYQSGCGPQGCQVQGGQQSYYQPQGGCGPQGCPLPQQY